MLTRLSRAGFTLMEMLIVFGVVAILSIVLIVTLNPSELLRQTRDSVRVSDFETINKAIRHFEFNSSGGSLGSSTVIYVSVPDPAATSSAGTDCASLNLPALTGGWTYHCASPANLRALDGTGWLPVKFSSDPSGSTMGALPVDPVNDPTFRLYYIYAASANCWELNAKIQSAKYGDGGARDVASTDGGNDPTLLESGCNLTSVIPAGAAGLGEGNIDPTYGYAWSENFGWLDLYNTNTVKVSASKLSGYASSSAGTVAFDCATSPNGDVCSSSNFGVTNDGSGHLSGWAWGDEAGWISFNCANDGSCGTANYAVGISATGTFTGWAWSENFGWISFNCANDGSCGSSNYKVITTWTP